MTAATPLRPAPAGLGAPAGAWLKRDDAHELGAFTWCGALPVLAAWRAEGARAVVTASTGNRGAATTWAAAQLGVVATVYVPPGAATAKVERIDALGADVRVAGAGFDEAKEAAAALAGHEGLPFFENGREPLQYESSRAIAAEILDALPELPGTVVVPLGNEALLGGIGLELRERSSSTSVVEVQAAAAPVMAESWWAGRPVAPRPAATFADELWRRGRRAGRLLPHPTGRPSAPGYAPRVGGICATCGGRIGEASTCRGAEIELADGLYRPVPWGAAADAAPAEACPGCGVEAGGYHHPGCTEELCPSCFRALLRCDCWR